MNQMIRCCSAYAIGVSVSLILLALLYAIVVDKHLAADGAYYFTVVLETKDFVSHEWSRQFANYLSQCLLLFAVTAGSKDVSGLSLMFGFSILLPWFLALSLSVYALRGESIAPIVLMLLCMVAVNLTSGHVLFGEHQVMVLLAWPILFLLLRRGRLCWVDAIVLWVLLVVFFRVYQTAVIPASIFFVISLMRLAKSEQRDQKIVFGVALILSLLVIMITSYFIFFPKSEANKAGFQFAMARALTTPEALASVSFLCLFFLGWYFRRTGLLIAAAIAPSAYVIFVLYTGHFLSVGSSFDGRTLSMTVAPLFMLAAIGVHSKRLTEDRVVSALFLYFVVVMVGANIYSTWEWSRFKHDMKAVLARQEGFVSLASTGLQHSKQTWGWTNPLLSIIWSDGCVHTVVQNPDGQRWEPPSPPASFPLKDYVCYSSYFAKYDKSVCTCSEKHT